MTQWGTWSPSSGLVTISYDKWSIRSDLTGVHFETATIAQDPYVTVEDVDKDNLPTGYKVSIMTLMIINVCRFTFEFGSNLQRTLS